MNLTGWLWDLRRSTSSPDYNSDAVDSIFLHDSMYSTLQQLNNHEASDTKVSTSPDMPSFEDKLDSLVLSSMLPWLLYLEQWWLLDHHWNSGKEHHVSQHQE
nr:uncharacterized protein LOC112801810 isoform X2 [Arachis hypogaea]